ncbi:expressed unknown protein [Seminavis robusta]|uniref:Uncharacterized protein n=1 Tax=Seminavis robusta TaxID=568900 RepID=A0A9N8DZE5_9STRA|nr:expressed unknown protein [Seminavis robusta]|eukprot:Sro468_g149190.1 n/a (279) ;mRNA; r:45894-46730
MGVQYHGATQSDARFSVSKREPDLVLRPTKEGMDFTLRVLSANRMSKVVEVVCDFGADGSKKISQGEVRTLFEALGGTAEEDEDMEDVDMVTDEYQPSNNKQTYKGMPLMESLSIVCQNATEDTPSFVSGLTYFVASSLSLARFTRLSLEGVNLRGTVLELRGLAETFRMHPRMHYVQLQACWFTPEQQADMSVLEQVFQEQKRRSSSARFSITSSQRHLTDNDTPLSTGGGLRQRKESATTNGNNKYSKDNAIDDDDDDGRVKSSWLKRLFQKCFCC